MRMVVLIAKRITVAWFNDMLEQNKDEEAEGGKQAEG